MKKYALREPISSDVSDSLAAYHPFVRDLLAGRGITDPTEAAAFLEPNYDTHIHDPFLLKDMKKCVERIGAAVSAGEKIAIYSDYDADGIPGAVVLHDFFKEIGYSNTVHYIPMRNEEGFGLNHAAVDDLASQGVKLLITIDCGITDSEEVATAAAHGIDVIITDHHMPGAQLPPAYAIINPKQDGCVYPEKMLCGSGVIFKVIQALIQSGRTNFRSGQEKWFLDMVGLATLSDMVPLRGENRVLSSYGLTVMRKNRRLGLSRLLSLLGIKANTLTEDDIAFMITPRINAASRMGVPRDAFRLLSTSDEAEAALLAEHLDNKNDERKGVVGSMVKEIKKKIHERGEEMKKVLVVGNPEWKPSLLGLVANSFSDEHGRPVFLWGREGSNGSSVIKGSCRAGGDTNVVSLMEKIKDVFIDYGGHKGAGGFSVSHEHIHTLEDRLNAAFEELLQEKPADDIVLVDRALSLDDVNWITYGHVERFAPFGCDNPKPLFLFERARISAVKLFGKEKNHLELKFAAPSGKAVSAIAFFSQPEQFAVNVAEGSVVNLVATLEKSTFRNFPELRLRIVDVF